MYKRDLVWATLNVINYLIEDGLFEEAQKILEEIQSCNGICYNDNNIFESNSSKSYYSKGSSQGVIYNTGCGCEK